MGAFKFTPKSGPLDDLERPYARYSTTEINAWVNKVGGTGSCILELTTEI